MLPKSKRRIYVGYDDGSNSVKYYNAETRKKSLEPVVITPNIPHEGESGADHMPQSGVSPEAGREPLSEPRKRKRSVKNSDDVDIDQPRRTRGLRPDYHIPDFRTP